MHIPGLIILIWIVVRVIGAARGSAGPRSSLQAKTLLRVVVSVIAVIMIAADGPGPFAVGMLVAWVVPTQFSYWVLVPLGIPYLNVIFQRAAHFGFGEPQAMFYEFLTRQSWTRVSPKNVESFEKQLRRFTFEISGGDGPYKDCALCLQAMLAVERGDHEGARALFEVVTTFPAHRSSSGTRQFAHGWLMADALARGEDARLLRLSQRGPWSLRRLYFRQLALDLCGRSRPWTRLLRNVCSYLPPTAWAARRVARSTPVRAPHELSLAEDCSLSELRTATFATLSAVPSTISRTDLRRLAARWDEVFEEGELLDELFEIAPDVDEHEIEAAEVAFREQVQDEFTAVWKKTVPDDVEMSEEESGLVLWAADEMLSEHLSELEDLVEPLPKDQSNEDLELDQRWRTWALIRSHAEAIESFGKPHLHALFDDPAYDLNNHAVWLHNSRDAHFIAKSIFTWLYQKAEPEMGIYPLVKENSQIG